MFNRESRMGKINYLWIPAFEAMTPLGVTLKKPCPLKGRNHRNANYPMLPTIRSDTDMRLIIETPVVDIHVAVKFQTLYLSRSVFTPNIPPGMLPIPPMGFGEIFTATRFLNPPQSPFFKGGEQLKLRDATFIDLHCLRWGWCVHH